MTGKRIGKVLQAKREAKGLTQQDLAKRAKVARSYLAKLEAGHSKNPSLAVLQRLAKALGVPVTALLE
jgi:transcriptional regulator with XRE-family HTH domain